MGIVDLRLFIMYNIMYVEIVDSFFIIYCKYEKYVFIGVLLFLGLKNL